MINLLDPIKVAWVSALLEGEGCFTISFRKSTNKTFYPTFWIACNMCDEDVLERLHEWTDCMGSLSGPFTPKNPKHSKFWRWRVGTRDKVYKLCKIIKPYMGKRRSAKIDVVISTMETSGRPPWKHGTKHAYEVIKCKCNLCRSEHARRHRQLRLRRKAF